MLPSQSLSSPSHTSVAEGFTVLLESSQSSSLLTYPSGVEQPALVPQGLPKPSQSQSRYQVEPPASSMLPSQSSSRPLQVSVPAGLTADRLSSQSSSLLTYPAGAEHATRVVRALP